MRIRSRLPIVVTLGVLLLFLGASFLVPRLPIRFVKNYSGSEKPGLYLVSSPDSVGRGDLVLISFPEAASSYAKNRSWLHKNVPLLKRIAATPSDNVCHENGSLTINGEKVASILRQDSEGSDLQSVSGCYTVQPGYFLPLNTYSPYSFDGRYFGPISTELIIGKAISLVTF